MSLRSYSALLLFLHFASAVASEETVVVKTQLGKLRGKVQLTASGARSFAFLGVPYARPPVGELRFADAETALPWNDVRDATRDGPACMQTPVPDIYEEQHFGTPVETVPQSEDCLLLNIFSPPSFTPEKNWPVIVFFHSVAWHTGTIAGKDGRVFAAHEGVIFVAVQFRLGVFGFLGSEGGYAPANQGIKDQIMALHWLSEHIVVFGGDPAKITLMGQGAGGDAVALHVVSPLSRSLFQRVVYASGSGMTGTLLVHQAELLPQFKDLVEDIGCTGPGVVPLQLSCLRSKSISDILKVVTANHYTFLPVIDGEVIVKHPIDSSSSHELAPAIQVMAGFCHNEGLAMAKQIVGKDFWTESFTEKDFRENVFHTVDSQFVHVHYGKVAITRDVVKHYTANTPTDQNVLKAKFLDFLTDIIVMTPVVFTALGHRGEGHPAYGYVLNYRPSFSQTPAELSGDRNDDQHFYGQAFIPGLNSKYNQQDMAVTNIYIKYICNFAKNGNPNGEGLANWPEISGGEVMLELKPNPTILLNYKEKEIYFWQQTVPKIIKEKQGVHEEL